MLGLQIDWPVVVEVDCTISIGVSRPPKYGILTIRRLPALQVLRFQITTFWVLPSAGYIPHCWE